MENPTTPSYLPNHAADSRSKDSSPTEPSAPSVNTETSGEDIILFSGKQAAAIPEGTRRSLLQPQNSPSPASPLFLSGPSPGPATPVNGGDSQVNGNSNGRSTSWKFSGTGQLVDEHSGNKWDIADEVMQMQVGGKASSPNPNSSDAPADEKKAIARSSPLATGDIEVRRKSIQSTGSSDSVGSSETSVSLPVATMPAKGVVDAPSEPKIVEEARFNGKTNGLAGNGGGLSDADLRAMQGLSLNDRASKEREPAHAQEENRQVDAPSYPEANAYTDYARQAQYQQQQQQYPPPSPYGAHDAHYMSYAPPARQYGAQGQGIQGGENEWPQQQQQQLGQQQPSQKPIPRKLEVDTRMPPPRSIPSHYANMNNGGAMGIGSPGEYHHTPSYGGVGVGVGAVGMHPTSFNGAAPGYLPPPHTHNYAQVQVHNGYAPQHAPLYDLVSEPMSPRGSVPAYRTRSSDPNGAGAGGPFSPMSPGPQQHLNQPPYIVQYQLAPQHQHAQHAARAYPAPPLHVPVTNGYPHPLPHQFYEDMYNQDAQNAAYLRYTEGSPHPGSPYGQPTYTVLGPDGLPLPQGPSANNRKLGLYKTELCRSWEEKGSCRYGPKCQFAHGEEEIRKVARHPKYKTEICRTFWVSGSCPYGKRCCFIHTELPTAGAPGGPPPPGGSDSARTPGGGGGGPTTAAAAPPAVPDGRARSMSTGSDPNDQPSSLLARITAKARGNEQFNGSADTIRTEGGTTPTYPFPPNPPAAAGPPGQAQRLPQGAVRPDFAHSRHLSSMSDGRGDFAGAENGFNGQQRPGHTHSASTTSAITPTYPSNEAYGRQYAAGPQRISPRESEGLSEGAAYWHRRSASGGNAPWTQGAADGSNEQIRGLYALPASTTAELRQ